MKMSNEMLKRAEMVDNVKKPPYKKVRKVGTVTVGISLVGVGVMTMAGMFGVTNNLEFAVKIIPIILVMFGIEVLVRYFMNKDGDLKYDVFGGFICCILMFWSLGMTVLFYMSNYWYLNL